MLRSVEGHWAVSLLDFARGQHHGTDRIGDRENDELFVAEITQDFKDRNPIRETVDEASAASTARPDPWETGCAGPHMSW